MPSSLHPFTHSSDLYSHFLISQHFHTLFLPGLPPKIAIITPNLFILERVLLLFPIPFLFSLAERRGT